MGKTQLAAKLPVAVMIDRKVLVRRKRANAFSGSDSGLKVLDTGPKSRGPDPERVNVYLPTDGNVLSGSVQESWDYKVFLVSDMPRMYSTQVDDSTERLKSKKRRTDAEFS